MSRPLKYNIPEYVIPQAGLLTPDDGHLYYGDHSKGFEIPAGKVIPHRHPYFEIFWLPDPSGTFLADFRTFPLKNPCLVFVSPGQVHGWPGAHGLKGDMIAFDDAFLKKTDESLLRSPLFYDPDSSPVVSVLSKVEMTSLWEKIAREYGEKLPDYIPALQSLIRLLIVSAHRSVAGSQPATSKRHSAGTRIFQSFIKLLSGDLPSGHLPKHYAQRLGISADYLSQCARKQSGHGAGHLIRRRVVLECKRLLAHSDLTISEIAYHLHFKDPSYFSRFFKKHTKQSPKEFREEACH